MTSGRRTDREEDSLAELVQRMFHRFRLQIHTAMPGHIVAYDAASRRATVQPALPMVIRGSRQLVQRPPILNIPVGHPFGNSLFFHIPVKPGQPVWLTFSERGIGKWKQNMNNDAEPDKGHYFDIADAIALPILSSFEGSPVTADGFSLQTEDGDTYLMVEEDNVKVKGLAVTVEGGTVTIKGSTSVIIQGGNVTITGNTTINGKSAADAGAGTGTADGHSHTLTGA